MATSNSLLHIGVNSIADIENLIRVYPNPVSDVLYIEWSSVHMPVVGVVTNHTTTVDIVLYDMLGRSVSVLHIVGRETNNALVHSLAVGSLPKGLYILSVGGERVKVLIE